jgi:hypothetical protein
MKPWQRLAAVIWDSQFLCAQRAVYLVSRRLAVYLDELARRRDEGLRKGAWAGDYAGSGARVRRRTPPTSTGSRGAEVEHGSAPS